MKLSKAKKLFKAGEIQLSTHCEMNTNQQNVFTNIMGMPFYVNTYYRRSKLGVIGDDDPFADDLPIIKVSDIKPGKKKTLKERVKALEEEIRTFPHKYARYENPLKEMLSSTTEPK